MAFISLALSLIEFTLKSTQLYLIDKGSNATSVSSLELNVSLSTVNMWKRIGLFMA